jgi:hypothetical protein
MTEKYPGFCQRARDALDGGADCFGSGVG